MRAAWASLQPGAVQVIQNVGQREREEAGITAEEEAHHFAGTDVADLTHEGRMAIRGPRPPHAPRRARVNRRGS